MNKTLLVFVLIFSVILSGCTRGPTTVIEKIPDVEPQTETQTIKPESTQFSAPFPNLDLANIDATENSIEIVFRNGKEAPITLPLTGSLTPGKDTICNNVVLSGKYNGAIIVAGQTVIPEGGMFTLRWDCDNLNTMPKAGDRFISDRVSFNYVSQNTGMTLTQTGAVDLMYR
jgi:hypothetical protein